MKQDFITQVQHWRNNENKIVVLSKDGKAYCRLLYYENENVQELWGLYVSEDARMQGRCNDILNYIDSISERKFTICYIEPDAPDWIKNMYEKRGYIIRILNN